MNDDIKKYSDIDQYVGQEVTKEILDDLFTSGRVKFPLKNTTTSAISQPADALDSRGPLDGPNLSGLLQSVKDNEDLVKTLEDMRDDMLKDMKIPPTSKDVSDAAKALGSTDGSITKDVLDTAEMILDPIMISLPLVPHLMPFGTTTVTGDRLPCNEVTKAMLDNWNLVADKDGELTIDEMHLEGQGDIIEDTRNAFRKKMKDMFKQVFNMLWWEMIWPRVVLFVLETTERIIGIPIDTLFLLFRFLPKRLIKENFMKYGPIHKAINKLKIILLCKVPTNAWDEYEPDPEIKVWNNNKSKFVSLSDFCGDFTGTANECPDLPNGDVQIPNSEFNTKIDIDGDPEIQPWVEDGEGDESTHAQMDKQIKELYPEGAPSCIPSRFGKLFGEEKIDGPALSPKCTEAAKIIIDAVYDDALRVGEYVGSKEQAQAAFDSLTDGSIKSANQETF